MRVLLSEIADTAEERRLPPVEDAGHEGGRLPMGGVTDWLLSCPVVGDVARWHFVAAVIIVGCRSFPRGP
jgi:hypothetical protein